MSLPGSSSRSHTGSGLTFGQSLPAELARRCVLLFCVVTNLSIPGSVSSTKRPRQGPQLGSLKGTSPTQQLTRGCGRKPGMWATVTCGSRPTQSQGRAPQLPWAQGPCPRLSGLAHHPSRVDTPQAQTSSLRPPGSVCPLLPRGCLPVWMSRWPVPHGLSQHTRPRKGHPTCFPPASPPSCRHQLVVH